MFVIPVYIICRHQRATSFVNISILNNNKADITKIGNRNISNNFDDIYLFSLYLEKSRMRNSLLIAEAALCENGTKTRCA